MNVIKYFNAPTLVEYSNYWLKAYKTGIRTNTRHNYEMIIRKFRKADVSITHLSKNDYLTILEGEPDYTKTRIALTIKQIIKCAISDGYLKADSIDRILGNITLPKTQPKITKRALTELETRAVYSIDVAPIEKLYLWTIFGCGLRREEALALTVDDVTSAGFTINKTLIFVDGKGTIEYNTKSVNSRRTVPIPKFLRDFLNDYIKNEMTGEVKYLFTYSRGNIKNSLFSIGYFQTMWRHIIKTLDDNVGYKTELTSHSFRHNYCSNLCYQIPKISIKTVAMLLGDTVDVALTTYNHIICEKEDRLGAIEDALKI